jgi:hypothetical protein
MGGSKPVVCPKRGITLSIAGADIAGRLIGAVKSGVRVPAVLQVFREFLAEGNRVLNDDYSPRVLVRRVSDPIPTHPRHVADVRGRMGTLLEAGLAGIWNEFIKASAEPLWRITVNYVTEYPDLYVRDPDGAEVMRIEVKALHDEADEGAARFDAPTPMIDEGLDILVILGWCWAKSARGKIPLAYPTVRVYDALGAKEVARERDTRFQLTGGRFKAGGVPYVRAKFMRTLRPDPGNYGKLNRIIHKSRRPEDLTDDVRRLADLLTTLYPNRRKRV